MNAIRIEAVTGITAADIAEFAEIVLFEAVNTGAGIVARAAAICAAERIIERAAPLIAAAERERIRQLSLEKEAQYLIDRGDHADFAAFADLISGES